MKKRTKQIFLIDDNAIFRFLFENLLNAYPDENIVLKCFENAVEALKFFSTANREFIPDILYVDINMPFMSGWELMEKFKTPEFAHLQTAKIYIVTSSDHESDRQNMEKYPFINQYLVKPLDQELLFDSIRNC